MSEMQLKEPSFLKVSIILELLVIALAVSLYGWNLEGLQALTRFSGRLSLLIFSVIFLKKNKFYLTFAIAHGIHLIELLSYVYFSGYAFNPVRAGGGMIAYAMIFIMPLISENNKRYKIFETVYAYFVWFIFFMTYLPRVMGKMPNAGGSQIEFMILMAWVVLMPVVAVIARLAAPSRSRFGRARAGRSSPHGTRLPAFACNGNYKPIITNAPQ